MLTRANSHLNVLRDILRRHEQGHAKKAEAEEAKLHRTIKGKKAAGSSAASRKRESDIDMVDSPPPAKAPRTSKACLRCSKSKSVLRPGVGAPRLAADRPLLRHTGSDATVNSPVVVVAKLVQTARSIATCRWARKISSMWALALVVDQNHLRLVRKKGRLV